MTVAGLLACLVLASFPSQPIVGTVDFVVKTFYRLTVAGTALDFPPIDESQDSHFNSPPPVGGSETIVEHKTKEHNLLMGYF